MARPPETSVRLTRRQRDLVVEILAGRSNKAIAVRLGVKEQTIKNQLGVLFRKLQVGSRLELAVKVRLGAISEPAEAPPV
jgi:two-component system, NarL family, nitrate/nitrite response regulator NarL